MNFLNVEQLDTQDHAFVIFETEVLDRPGEYLLNFFLRHAVPVNVRHSGFRIFEKTEFHSRPLSITRIISQRSREKIPNALPTSIPHNLAGYHAYRFA